MKRKLEFEFDLRDVEDQAKLRALNVMAQALENAEQTKAFIQVANAIANGHHINITPKGAETPKEAPKYEPHPLTGKIREVSQIVPQKPEPPPDKLQREGQLPGPPPDKG
jgi:hypothetical protein